MRPKKVFGGGWWVGNPHYSVSSCVLKSKRETQRDRRRTQDTELDNFNRRQIAKIVFVADFPMFTMFSAQTELNTTDLLKVKKLQVPTH